MDAFQEVVGAQTIEELDAIVRRCIEDQGLKLVVGLSYIENAEHFRQCMHQAPAHCVQQKMITCAILMAAHTRWLALHEAES